MKKTGSSIFKNYQFLRLWGNQVIFQFGFNISNYSALLILADRTHSQFVQAQFYAALTIPAFIFGFIAGPVVDLAPKKRIMLLCDFLLCILFLSYIFADGKIVLIMFIAFLTSSVARFFIPAEAATIPLIVNKNSLDQANAVFLFTLMGSILLGYTFAGPIINSFGGLRTTGELAPFVVSSLLLPIGFVLLLGLKRIKELKPKVSGTLFKKTFNLFWETILEIRRNYKISLPILLLVFVQLNIGILTITFLEYVRRYLKLPTTEVSLYLMIPLIIGLVVGIMSLKRIEKQYGQRKSIFMSCLGIGFLFFALGILPVLGEGNWAILLLRTFAIFSSFVVGILIVVVSVQARTILQTNASLSMQGRIFSFVDILIALATPVPVLFIGFVADKISLLVALVVIGLVIIVGTVMGKKIFFEALIRKSAI